MVTKPNEAVRLLNFNSSVNSKIVKTKNHHTFLLRCRDDNTVPNGLKRRSPIHTDNPFIFKILHQASSRILKVQVQQLRRKKASLENYEVQQPPAADKPIGKTIRHETYTKKTVINLSSKQLTTAQTSLLCKGLKFVPTCSNIKTDEYIIGIESGLQQLAPNGNIDYLRHQIADLIKQSPKQRSNLSPQERKAINELRNDKNITITEADKGKAAVIMDTPDFHDLVNKTLSDTSTYKILPKDPTAKLERQHKKTLKTLHDSNQINCV
ncbi:uncharacterized protein [Haliotis asinina]|uniref:uncharacterized protein n=1 Tax=Haliotis asinina TaxID=109174 RepID=UPI003531981C